MGFTHYAGQNRKGLVHLGVLRGDTQNGLE